MKRFLKVLGVTVVALMMFGPTVLTRVMVPVINPILPQPEGPPSAEATAMHGTLDVADLHGDFTLWDRSLLRRQETGHIDLPRLLEGRVYLQMFTAPTKTPAGMNVEANPSDSDQLTLLTLTQAWPPRTWTSLAERAIHQARKLHDAAARTDQLVVVTSRAELEAWLRLRAEGQQVVAGLLGIEGAHAIEGSLDQLDRVYAAGHRMMGLTHFFDNEVGGSAHGMEKGGLTDFGRRAVPRMEELGIAIDLAHASPTLIDDVLEIATKPIIVSHTGVRGTCESPRNLDDARLVGIAATGGVIGIGLWPTAVCGETADTWAAAVRHTADLVGAEHVGVGSDWDGGVPAIVDPSGMVHLTDALLRAGFTADEIRLIMGENVIRVLRETLPAAP